MPAVRPATVLVSDPDETGRAALGRLVAGAGYHLVTASGIDDVMAAIPPGPGEVDVVVLAASDMLRASGAFARIKQKAGRFLPLLAINPSTSPAERAETLRAGADDCVSRPFDPGELLARLAAQLRVKRAFDAAASASGSPVAPGPAPAPRPVPALTPSFGVSLDTTPQSAVQRHGPRRLKEEFSRAERYKEPLSLMVASADADVAEGARAMLLAEVTLLLEKTVRAQDLVVRLDGDEFCVLLPNTHFVGSLAIAERALRELAQKEFRLPDLGTVRPRLAVGVACYPGKDIASSDELLRLARTALTRARSEGPGKICIYQYQGYIYQPA